MSKIKIVGSTQTHELDDVKESVIHRGGAWYWRHDDVNLRRIKTPDNKTYLYRRESELICQTMDGDYRRKKDCYNLGGNNEHWLYKKSPSLVVVDGEPTHINFTVRIGDQYYLKSDDRLVRNYDPRADRQVFILKENAVKLSEKYGKDSWTANNEAKLITIEDEVFFRADCPSVVTLDSENNKIISLVNPRTFKKSNYVNVFVGFKDRTNPQHGRWETALVDTRVYEISSTEWDMYVLKRTEKDDLSTIYLIRDQKVVADIKAAKDKFDANYDERDENENNPTKWSKDYKTHGGKQRIAGHNDLVVPSRTFKHTGGLRYSIGVELETSGGMLPAPIADRHALLMVGDRSIGSAEYVTGVLQGDAGMKYLKDICSVIADHTMVDKRCGLHFHIGNFPEMNDESHAIQFNRQFAIAAIKLGCKLEKEIYEILPESRSPYNYHCYSILRYKGIDETNWKEYLGTYLFGPREDQIPDNLDFSRFTYGSANFNKNVELDTWCGGRYKWLNLVRAYTRCSAPTIEFRVFPGSTFYPKIYHFLMICMAFVYICNNKYKEVMEDKYDLEGIIKTTYSKYPTIKNSILNFIAERKEKFNRKNIYTKKK